MLFDATCDGRQVRLIDATLIGWHARETALDRRVFPHRIRKQTVATIGD
jgi:hypothetical protein